MISVRHSLLSALTLFAGLWTAVAADSNKVVIIKADDFRGPNLAWTNFLQVSRSAGVKVSIGVIVDSIAGNASIASWMQAQEAQGDVEFWDHGWDHLQWTTNSQTVSEFQGSGVTHQRAHFAQAQAALNTALGHDVIAFGTGYNGFDADTATVINETSALRLFFTHSVASATSLVAPRVAILDIISESDGTAKPNAATLKATMESRAPGPVSLQFHPPYFDAAALTEYGKIVNYLLTNGYSIKLPSEFAPATTNYDVYLVGGQSNMDGRGRTNELTNSLSVWLPPQADVRIYYANPINLNPTNPTYQTGWQMLAPGFSVPPGFAGALPSGDFGPELSFARTMADADPARRIALIKVTQGGTSLSSNWNPASGYMYATLTNTVRAAMSALQSEGNTGTLRGMIWHQGESDTGGGGALYATNLSAFISSVRSNFAAPNLPFVVGEIATNNSASFRQGQLSVSQTVPHVGFASADGLQTYEGTHFITPDVLVLGQRFAAALQGLPATAVNLTNSDAANTSSFNTAGNWDSGAAPSVGYSYNVGSAYTLRTPTNQAQAYAFAGDSLTLAGVLSFKMTNVITVPDLRLDNGTVANFFAGGNPNTGRLAGNVNVLANGVIDAGGSGLAMRIFSTIQGNGALTIIRPNAVTLSANNSYNGPLTVAGSTLELDSTGSLTPSSLSLMNYVSGSTRFNTVTNIVRAGGSLSVGNGPSSVLRVGYRNASGTNCIAVLDVSKQAQFTANVGEFAVGLNQFNDSLTTVGSVLLATNNTVTATNVLIADSAYAPGGTSTMVLGRGSNYFNTPTMIVGARKENGQLTLSAGGVFRLDNGAGRTDLTVCGQNFGTGSSPVSAADLSGGPFIASLGTLTIGQKTLGLSGGATGTLTLGSAANNVNVNAVVVGNLAGAASGSPVAQGTLSFGGGSFRVNNDVTLASFDGGIGSAVGTLNIGGGKFAVAGDIVDGGGTSTLNVTGGVVDLKPSGDLAAGSVTVDALLLDGTLSNALDVTVNALSGSGTIASQTGVTTVTGALAPGGAGLGSLNVQGKLTLSGTTTIQWQKNGAIVTNDSVRGLTKVMCGGALVLSNIGGVPLVAGDALKIFDAASYVGLFSDVVPGSPGPNLLWDFSTFGTDGTLRVVAVPSLSATVAGANLQLNLTGTPGQLYCILTSTNVVRPLSQWSPWTNGLFSASPLVLPASRAEPQRFFTSASPGYLALTELLQVQASTKPTNAAWNWYDTRTLDHLPTPVQLKADAGFSQYGGLLARRTNATGFFYPLKINDRWWLVDPQGYLFLHRGMAVVNTIPTPGAEAALQAKFGNTANWAAATTSMLRQHGFNGAGAWSDNTRLRAVSPPLVYTIIVDFLSPYAATNTNPGYPQVFEPSFANYCDKRAQQFTNTVTDAWLLGYFSDNELPFPSTLLTTFLGLSAGNSSYEAAWAWLRGRYGPGATVGDVTTQDRYDFLGYVWGRYYEVVSQAIKRYDPNHLYLGTRFFSSDKDRPEIFRAIAPYVDVVSVNHYSQWTPDISRIQMWERESGRPVIITEWYVKGEDSGMPNNSGAGWVVRTQRDRGLFYENFSLALLESKVCVGWHWFKYADNDPDNTGADPSNIDSNKGIVSNRYEPYAELLGSAKRINERAYRLADYFDGTVVP